VKENYHGNDQVTASGHSMHINHIGHSEFTVLSSKSSHLRCILNVPSVTRSILNVRRLIIDNKGVY
jgi:hypothetical protein